MIIVVQPRQSYPLSSQLVHRIVHSDMQLHDSYRSNITQLNLGKQLCDQKQRPEGREEHEKRYARNSLRFFDIREIRFFNMVGGVVHDDNCSKGNLEV